MAKNKSDSPAVAELRSRAEESLRAKTKKARLAGTDEDSQRLVHELEVHQIELEMQNEELRRARDAEAEALGKYTDLFDFAPVGYFTFDRNGGVNAVNLTGAALIGVERSKLIGRRFGQFVSVADRPAFTAFLGRVFTSRGKEECEVALRKDEKKPFVVQIEAVASASGEEGRAAVMDISARRQMEEKLKILHTELVARASELESANVELEAFNYSVSHDLRRPLTAINSYCQVLEELCGNKLDEQCRGYIREMYEGTLRMNRLIDTLLDFSRITRVEMRHEEVDLSKMAEEVATRLKMTDLKRRVKFRIAAGIVTNGDSALLRVVLDNLIGNAWKYTGRKEGAVIEFGVKEIDGTPVCFVRDNGPGFEMAHAVKLFKPFQRLPGAEEFRGHGIGLATVKRIIKRHGGKVWAEGETGKGACFYFTISAD